MNKFLCLTLSLLSFPIFASASSPVNDAVSEQYLVTISNQLQVISADIKLQNTMLEDKHNSRCYWEGKAYSAGAIHTENSQSYVCREQNNARVWELMSGDGTAK